MGRALLPAIPVGSNLAAKLSGLFLPETFSPEDKEAFLKSVLQRTEELKAQHTFSEDYLSEFLVNSDLLAQTVKLLEDTQNIPELLPEDIKSWNNSLGPGKGVCLQRQEFYKHQSPCEFPLEKVYTNFPGKPRYYVPKEVLVELRGLNRRVRSQVCLSFMSMA